MIWKTYLVAIIAFLAIDMVWLGVVAKNFYQNQIGFLLKSDVNWAAAIIFYALFIGALMIFVILPAIEKESLIHALLYGALFGFITYATYDLTNLATLKDWPVLVTIVDLIWGSVLSASVSVITYSVITRFFI